MAHAVADLYVGMIAPVLLPMRDHYQLSFGAMVFIAALLGFCANLFQLLVGHLRARWQHPGVICGGTLLASLAVFIPSLPAGAFSLAGMLVLAVTAGFGVAMVHPEGLRAVHGLDRIPTSFSIATFMVSGFMGFACGAMVSSHIVERQGLEALRWLSLLAPVAAGLLWIVRVRLPVEAHREATSLVTERMPSLPFPTLFIVGTLLTVSSSVQATLLPSYLHKEAGYSLSFSGLSFTLFGLGGTVGTLLWGALAPRLGHLRVILVSTLLGVPLTILYLWLAPQTTHASALLVLTGFIVYVGFPLCVALARSAKSKLRLTQRMGIMSGGTWAIAAVVLWCLGPISSYTGLKILLHLIWLGYGGSAIILWILSLRAKSRQKVQ